MKLEPLDALLPALQQIGAILVGHRVEPRANESIAVRSFIWRGRIIETAWSITEGLQVTLTELNNKHATTIFSYTVPRFNDFNDDEKYEWLLSVPDGPEYAHFVADHIRKLPQAVL